MTAFDITEHATGPHIVTELGLDVTEAETEIYGHAAVVSELYVPGTTAVRTSVFAAWTDVLAGLLAMRVFTPRVPVTLDLDVHMFPPTREHSAVSATSRLIKRGNSVVVLAVDWRGDDDEEIGFGTASFMVAPNPTAVFPPEMRGLPRQRGRLSKPLAQRARCTVPKPGVASIPKAKDALNASNTLNGGLTALVVEEAALSLTPGATLSSLAMRYLRPVRTGPAVATATVHDGVGRVEVRDAGDEEKLAVYAVTQIHPAAGAAADG